MSMNNILGPTSCIVCGGTADKFCITLEISKPIPFYYCAMCGTYGPDNDPDYLGAWNSMTLRDLRLRCHLLRVSTRSMYNPLTCVISCDGAPHVGVLGDTESFDTFIIDGYEDRKANRYRFRPKDIVRVEYNFRPYDAWMNLPTFLIGRDCKRESDRVQLGHAR